MTTAFLQKMKARLIEEKSRLERDLGDIAVQDPKQPDKFKPTFPESGSDSEDDNSVEATDLADEISLGAKLESELRDVMKALKSLDDGTYGVCKYCHKEIDEKRLEARPTSSTCIDCKKTLTQEM